MIENLDFMSFSLAQMMEYKKMRSKTLAMEREVIHYETINASKFACHVPFAKLINWPVLPYILVTKKEISMVRAEIAEKLHIREKILMTNENSNKMLDTAMLVEQM